MAEQRDTVVGAFDNREDARCAIDALKDAGFARHDVSLLMSDGGVQPDVAGETDTKAEDGAGVGAIAGGVLGGLAGWLVALGGLSIPGVGPFIAAGAFASALGGATAGAATGGIAGALIGAGIPEDDARYIEGEVRSGCSLVMVRSDDSPYDAERILRAFGARDVRRPHHDANATSRVAERKPVDRTAEVRAATATTEHVRAPEATTPLAKTGE